MIASAPFTLCKLSKNDRIYWYALFRDPQTGKRTNKKSVEKLRKELGIQSTQPIKRRDEAILICKQALDAGLLFGKKTPTTLFDYLSLFFDWEKSPYVEKRNLLDPGSLSQDYISTRQNLVSNHVLPLIHHNLLLSVVTTRYMEQLQLSLVKKGKLSHATVNICMQAVTMAVREAQRAGLIDASVSIALRPLKCTHRMRGILSEDELSNFMQYLKTSGEKRMYLACLLSLLTGMRSGELRGLHASSISSGLITVEFAYANKAGLKEPKGKKTRLVPCPAFLCEELLLLGRSNPFGNGNDLVFWSRRTGSYVSSHYFSEKLQGALVRSKVLEKQEILDRNITFHSLRHMANTLLRGSVDEHVLRMTIGHSSEQLSDLYTHLSQRGLKSVELAQQNNILPLLGENRE
ncbi:site-specific recombinase XerD [Sphaerochaeta pleomorpha str. Grapes]|uniref:Site-specific recombinase XerD n=1 Tax=Sphaerochaeta pleomorpha (strain ATCC BAA-1885 / DSM 22778 / Grapes) TaxID=158190 RepID=G8QVL7_SPHPG|nr:tyrosine-type recombinase/integrase [Sphaerochaeta pleomorpha]AEV28250.1 site-specific recombinase XerD [Sphaerochaeta pleomorpha str. Grapes]